MSILPHERIALFIDGANLYSAARGLNVDLDFAKLLASFRDQAVLIRAHYYTAVVEGEEFSPIRPLVDWLGYNGFSVVTKPAKRFTDAQGHSLIKGNMDIEIAVDMLELAPRLDHVVLFSGDGDFRRLVQAVQAKGVRVTVVSTLKSQPPMLSDDLRRQADASIDLADRLATHAHHVKASGGGDPIDQPLATSLGLDPETLRKLMAEVGFVPAGEAWKWRGNHRPARRADPPRPGNAFAALAGLKQRQ